MDGVFHPVKFGSNDQTPAAPQFVWPLSPIKQDTFNGVKQEHRRRDLTFKHFTSFELAQMWVDFDTVSQNLIKLKGARIFIVHRHHGSALQTDCKCMNV